MIEKITTLVFGLLAFGLEVWSSIVNPTVESIVASVFALVIVICAIVALCRRVVIVEDEPKGKRNVDAVLQLSSRLSQFVKRGKGKVSITIER